MIDTLVELWEDEPRDPEWLPGAVIPGYKSRVNKRDIRVIEIDIEADPEKRDPEFVRRLQKLMPQSQFRREIRRDWTAGDGDMYFPEFIQNGGRRRYVVPLTALLKDEPIRRGWDFGIRAPACVWFQFDRKRRRVLIFRSLTPTYMPMHDMRDLVLYLSGQIPREALDPEMRPFALAYLNVLENTPGMPATPWFKQSGPTPMEFRDYGGAEAWRTDDLVQGKNVARSRAEVLAEAGVNLEQVGAAGDRDTVMRDLLAIREDGWPGLLMDGVLVPGELPVSPQNELLLKALAGGLVWATPTDKDPNPEGYRKDGIHDNVYEALSYGTVGVVPVQREPRALAGVIYRDRRPDAAEEGFYENRGDRWHRP